MLYIAILHVLLLVLAPGRVGGDGETYGYVLLTLK